MTSPALASVRARLHRYAASDDPSAVLEHAALQDAGRAFAHFAHSGWTPEALLMVGNLYFARYAALPDGQGLSELNRALALFETLWHREPVTVPVWVRNLLVRHDRLLRANGPAERHRAEQAQRSALGGDEETLLQEAVRTVRAEFDETPLAAPNWAEAAATLATYLQMGFARTTDVSSLDEAIQLYRAALRTTDRVGLPLARWQSNLGVALLSRFEQDSALPGLEEAVGLLRAACANAPSDAPEVASFASNLGDALLWRYEYTGRLDDMDEAVALIEQAEQFSVPEDPDHPAFLLNLAAALQFRWDSTGSSNDLDRAISYTMEALERIPVDDPVRPEILVGLAASLTERSAIASGADTDLRDARDAVAQALHFAPQGHPARLRALACLGTVLGTSASATTGPQSERYAVAGKQALSEALTLVPTGAAQRPTLLSGLGLACLRVAEETRFLRDLDEAIDYLRQAVSSTLPQEPRRAKYLINLGQALISRRDVVGELADLDEAQSALAEASAIDEAAAAVRLFAARLLGEVSISASAQDPAAGLHGFSAAVRLAPRVAWHGLPQHDQQRVAEALDGLGRDAAATAIAAGRLEEAVELVEQGRALLWANRLQHRHDLDELYLIDPVLAARLDEVRRHLDGRYRDEDAVALPPGASPRVSRHYYARQFDDLLREVRHLPGLEDFLRTPTFEELAAAAEAGPVIILNVSRYRSDALVVRVGEVEVVPLDEGLFGDVVSQTRRYLEVTESLEEAHSARDVQAVRRSEAALDEILAWLWSNVTEPVLRDLRQRGLLCEPQSLRVFWCPTGPLTLLPLHAAGLAASREADSVLSQVVSSYTLTLGALRRSRDTQAQGQTSDRMLLITQATTPGQGDLPGSLAEAAAVTETLSFDVTHLADIGVTKQAVRAELPLHSYCHYSGHGAPNLEHPAEGGLLLQDGLLRVGDLADLRLSTELAVLFACHTAVGGVRLTDEGLHLGAALQFAGCRHILATLWSISDATTVSITTELYRQLTVDACFAVERAPYALHHASIQLRGQYPEFPSEWSRFIHVGP